LNERNQLLELYCEKSKFICMAKRKQDIISYIPDEIITTKIFVIRGQKVMLDFDIAQLYGVETKRLNEQVKRNIDRFPEEFMFRLKAKEWNMMRSQIATAYSQSNDFEDVKRKELASSKQRKRNTNITPFAFTEHGVTMAANVLKSEKAVKMSIAIVKTFIQLTKQALDFGMLAEQVKLIDHKIDNQDTHLVGHDIQLKQIYEALEDLMDKKVEEKNWEERERIGFKGRKIS
jgi:ORF6N domain